MNRTVKVTLAQTSNMLLVWATALGVFSCEAGDVAAPGEIPESRASPFLASVATEAQAFSLIQISAGWLHACGVAPDNRAYCWGDNEPTTYGDASGQLGDGTTTTRLKPVLVSGGLRFFVLSAGTQHTCGVTTDSLAYCWGLNVFGMLGDGTTATRLIPTRVAGGLRFRTVSTSGSHTCGVTTTNKAYCWGYNSNGQLGDGTSITRLRPVAVLGGLSFRHVVPGYLFSCGVTTGDKVFCWGLNSYGQLGNGSTVAEQLTPVSVAGTRSFRQVTAGFRHACAVTTSNKAFCWGYGADGQIGDGRTFQRGTPVAVAGGLSFNRVSAGFLHTCGQTTDQRAYCWGQNAQGQVGDGTSGNIRLLPTATVGAVPFIQVSAGTNHSCGRTSSRSYCWGDNQFGQLGDGTRSRRLAPVPVIGSM